MPSLSPSSADILVIDDNPDNLRLLLTVLGEQGYRVRPVTSGALGIAAAQLEPPELILLDIKMPEMDGYDVCRQLKADARTADIPVIFLTVLDDDVDIVKGFELGGVDYITKPVRTGELLARVENRIALRSLAKQLRAQKDFLQVIYNSVDTFISVLEVVERDQFEIVDVNETALKMTGYTREQMIGANVTAFVAPEVIRRNHEVCVATKQPVTREEPIELMGKTTWWLSTHTPLCDESGAVTRLIGTAINITERRLAEQQLAKKTEELTQALDNLKATQSELVRSAKMAALGNLVAGVAHEINTPVGTAIMTASSLENASQEIAAALSEGELKKSSFQNYLEIATECSHLISSNLRRAGELIQSFKQVAVDQSSLQQRTFALRSYLQEVITNLTPKLKQTPHQIQLLADTEITLSSYPGAIAQVVTNLIINSLTHAYPTGEAGQICLEVTQTKDHTTLCYSDDGCGIPPDAQDHIFEPFFTTARAQGGSGLGLHLVYNLVTQKLKGSIAVTHSSAHSSGGTLFTITLPNRIDLPHPTE
ncbi:MAG: response regulator [Cyanobacteria bacterium J06648_10]